MLFVQGSTSHVGAHPCLNAATQQATCFTRQLEHVVVGWRRQDTQRSRTDRLQSLVPRSVQCVGHTVWEPVVDPQDDTTCMDLAVVVQGQLGRECVLHRPLVTQ